MSTLVSTIKYFATDVFLDFLAFPVWWYSRGLLSAAERFRRHLKFSVQITGIKIWVLNLFKPMFGETSYQGRLISFAMRFLFLIFKTILFIILLAITIIVFLVWIALPPFVIYMIIRQLS